MVYKRTLRMHTRTDGREKIPYDTLEEAAAHALYMQEKYTRDLFDAYRCTCKKYHIGRQGKNKMLWQGGIPLELLEPELGMRVLSHLKAENYKSKAGRLEVIRKRWRAGWRRQFQI